MRNMKLYEAIPSDEAVDYCDCCGKAIYKDTKAFMNEDGNLSCEKCVTDDFYPVEFDESMYYTLKNIALREGAIWDGIKSIGKGIWNTIKRPFVAAGNSIGNGLNNIGQQLQGNNTQNQNGGFFNSVKNAWQNSDYYKNKQNVNAMKSDQFNAEAFYGKGDYGTDQMKAKVAAEARNLDPSNVDVNALTKVLIGIISILRDDTQTISDEQDQKNAALIAKIKESVDFESALMKFLEADEFMVPEEQGGVPKVANAQQQNTQQQQEQPAQAQQNAQQAQQNTQQKQKAPKQQLSIEDACEKAINALTKSIQTKGTINPKNIKTLTTLINNNWQTLSMLGQSAFKNINGCLTALANGQVQQQQQNAQQQQQAQGQNAQQTQQQDAGQNTQQQQQESPQQNQEQSQEQNNSDKKPEEQQNNGNSDANDEETKLAIKKEHLDLFNYMLKMNEDEQPQEQQQEAPQQEQQEQPQQDGGDQQQDGNNEQQQDGGNQENGDQQNGGDQNNGQDQQQNGDQQQQQNGDQNQQNQGGGQNQQNANGQQQNGEQQEQAQGEKVQVAGKATDSGTINNDLSRFKQMAQQTGLAKGDSEIAQQPSMIGAAMASQGAKDDQIKNTMQAISDISKLAKDGKLVSQNANGKNDNKKGLLGTIVDGVKNTIGKAAGNVAAGMAQTMNDVSGGAK